MPPLPSPGKVIKLEFEYHNLDSKAVNIFYLAYAGTAPSITDLTNLDAAVRPDFQAMMGRACVSSTVGDSTKYTDLQTSTGHELLTSLAITGTLTGDVVSSNGAVCVSKEILRRYRGGHPRTYLMAGSATVLAGSSTNQWQASFLANIESDFTTWVAAINAYNSGGQGQLTFVNVSYRSGNAIRVTPVVDTVVSTIVRTRVCSQRRRLGKVGE